MTNAARNQTQEGVSFRRAGQPKNEFGIDQNNLDDYLAGGALKAIHPGEIFALKVVKERNLQVVDVAATMGISREMLYKILRGQSSVTAKTAIAMSKVAGNSAEFWLRGQVVYDLWKERTKHDAKQLVHT